MYFYLHPSFQLDYVVFSVHICQKYPIFYEKTINGWAVTLPDKTIKKRACQTATQRFTLCVPFSSCLTSLLRFVLCDSDSLMVTINVSEQIVWLRVGNGLQQGTFCGFLTLRIKVIQDCKIKVTTQS